MVKGKQGLPTGQYKGTGTGSPVVTVARGGTRKGMGSTRGSIKGPTGTGSPRGGTRKGFKGMGSPRGSIKAY